MRTTTCTLATAALLVLAWTAQPAEGAEPDKPAAPPGPVLNDETFDKWLGALLPRQDDLLWQQLGWQPTLAHAVIEAQKLDKPILLWSMHGHPLAEV